MKLHLRISSGWRGVRSGLLVLGCLTALSSLPSAVSAKQVLPANGPKEACPIRHVRLNVTYECSLEFTLRASNGYRITVSGEPDWGRRQPVQLTVTNHSGTAEYSTEGVVTATALRASFGRFGKVSVRFHPSGALRRVKVSKGCKKGRPRIVTSRLGDYRGTIRFRGERGYTRVSTHTARGGIGDPLANRPRTLSCDFRESKVERERELQSVSLGASPSGAGVSFAVFRLFGNWSRRSPAGGSFPPKVDEYLFFAFETQKVGPMRIFRYAGAFGGSEDFVFDDALTTAEVTPPAPYSGTGSFVRNADGSTSWTGTLSVSLPGLGTVSLTGGKAELATVAARLKQMEEEAPPSRRAFVSDATMKARRLR